MKTESQSTTNPQLAVDAWNAQYQPGTEVLFWSLKEWVGDINRAHFGCTTSPAFVLGGHSPCIMIDSVGGCVHLGHVLAKFPPPREAALPASSSVNPGGDWITSQSSQRFMLFGGSFAPLRNGPIALGGWDDYVASYPTTEAAQRAAEAFSLVWWQVVHRFDLKVVASK